MGREVGYHGRLGKRKRKRRALRGEEEQYVSSLRSTVEGSGSPSFAGELHYLWPTSRLVAGTSWRRGHRRSQSNASSSDSAIQRCILGHIATIYSTNAQQWRVRDEPFRCSLLGMSLERKLSSAFHQLLGEIAVMQPQELPVFVHVHTLSSFDGLTTSAPLI
jgi:hypothetical protein